MSRLRLVDTPKRPDLRRIVAICMACHHWQIDVRAGAIAEHGGWMNTMQAFAQAHADHIASDCAGGPGRVNFAGKWVEPPLMKDGTPAQTAMEMHPLPRWWVTK